MQPLRRLLLLLCAPAFLLACADQSVNTAFSSVPAPLASAQAYLQRGDGFADRHAQWHKETRNQESE
jgi:hypothetical protein